MDRYIGLDAHASRCTLVLRVTSTVTTDHRSPRTAVRYHRLANTAGSVWTTCVNRVTVRGIRVPTGRVATLGSIHR